MQILGYHNTCPNPACKDPHNIEFWAYNLVDGYDWEQDCECKSCGLKFKQCFTMKYDLTEFEDIISEGQTREEINKDTYTVISGPGPKECIVVFNEKTKEYQQWIRDDKFPGHVLIINGTAYKFVKSL